MIFAALLENYPIPMDLQPGELGTRSRNDNGVKPWWDLLLRETLKPTPRSYFEITHYRAWASDREHAGAILDGDLVLMLCPQEESASGSCFLFRGAGTPFRVALAPGVVVGWDPPCALVLDEGPARIFWSLSF